MPLIDPEGGCRQHGIVFPTTHQRMSAAAYRELPEGPPHFQLIAGELFISPSPRFWHQQIVGSIFSAIREHLRSGAGGTVVVSPSDVELTAQDVFQPDVYFVSEDRRSILTDQGASGAPDLVVEVLSPATARLDTGPKRDVYAAAGVVEMWIVHPQERRVEVFLLQQSKTQPQRVLEPGGVLETELIPGFRMEVAEVFAGA